MLVRNYFSRYNVTLAYGVENNNLNAVIPTHLLFDPKVEGKTSTG